jgi:cytoskeletal protein RodZ
MSLTLGEKLQQAREARGITISEVAEQTRISSLYLEAIENNDYRTLPGGIFNKGFVKSYARYVGVDEQEALHDYSQLLTEQQGENADEMKVYRPEVLTDASTRSSSITTIVFAVIILGLMTWGILALVNYLQETKSTPPANNSNTSNVTAPANNSNANPPAATAPTMSNLKVEFKAIGAAVSLTSNSDDTPATKLVAAETSVTFEPKEKLRLSFSKTLAQNVQLTINGKPISLPLATPNWKRNVEIEITESNLAQIWQSGQFASSETATPTPAAATPKNKPTVTPTAAKTPPANTTTNRGNVNGKG